MKKTAFLLLAIFVLSAALPAHAQRLETFERNVTEHVLDNGLRIIIVKRDVAPVATFMTYVNVGAVNEPVGNTGIAHIFEHMAFKGSSRIGTSNWEAEKPLLEEIDATYARWLREVRSPRPNQARADSLLDRFNTLEQEAKQYVVNNEFSQIIDLQGGVGLNAGTSADYTVYFYALPQNKAELWFSLEAERFKDPVLREFYVEKDVVYEERRTRTDSNPVGRLLEEMLAISFTAHPYRDTTIGWPSDIEATTMADALEFYRTFYVPTNMHVVIVGDVNPATMIEYAELYLGDIPQGEPAPPMYVEEPPQRGERRFVIEERNQPQLLLGYKVVDANHPDAVALDLLSGVLFEGRSSRMNKALVDEQKLALGFQGLNGFPGSKYTNLMAIYAVPNQGISLDSLETAIYTEIDKVKQEGILTQELERIKTIRRASLLRQLGSNDGIGFLIAETQGTRGDWRAVFTDLEAMNQVTVEDLQRVASQYLVKDQRTVGWIKNNAETASN
jgi:predicted Zn-dependent peptidase